MKKLLVGLLLMSSFAAQAGILEGIGNVVEDVTDTGRNVTNEALGRDGRYYRDGYYGTRYYRDGRHRDGYYGNRYRDGYYGDRYRYRDGVRYYNRDYNTGYSYRGY